MLTYTVTSKDTEDKTFRFYSDAQDYAMELRNATITTANSEGIQWVTKITNGRLPY